MLLANNLLVFQVSELLYAESYLALTSFLETDTWQLFFRGSNPSELYSRRRFVEELEGVTEPVATSASSLATGMSAKRGAGVDDL